SERVQDCAPARLRGEGGDVLCEVLDFRGRGGEGIIALLVGQDLPAEEGAPAADEGAILVPNAHEVARQIDGQVPGHVGDNVEPSGPKRGVYKRGDAGPELLCRTGGEEARDERMQPIVITPVAHREHAPEVRIDLRRPRESDRLPAR